MKYYLNEVYIMKKSILSVLILCGVLLAGCTSIDVGINKDQLTQPATESVVTTTEAVTSVAATTEPGITVTEPTITAAVSETTAKEPATTVTEAEATVTELTTLEPQTETETETKTETQEPQKEDDDLPELPNDYYFQTEDDYFFIVNKEMFLPDDYEIETETVQGSYEMEITAAYYCRNMIEAAAQDGIGLKVISAYRSVSYQEGLFERNVRSRMEDYGMSYEEAYYDTAINIAPPGGSEHNAGLAADIVTEDDWDTYTGFEDTEEFKWLQEHAAEYGFIMRYPRGKEEITGYIYEPWHYRYVGVKYAKDVAQSGLCLEEYFEKYVWNTPDSNTDTDT